MNIIKNMQRRCETRRPVNPKASLYESGHIDLLVKVQEIKLNESCLRTSLNASPNKGNICLNIRLLISMMSLNMQIQQQFVSIDNHTLGSTLFWLCYLMM